MGGPSNPLSEVNSVPLAPPLGFENPIPAYAAAWDYNALHPEGPYGGPWTTGYPTYGYQQPPPPQPLHQQPPQPQLIPPECQQEVLERLDRCEREIRTKRRHNKGFFKGLADLIKGKSKRRDY
ncbi:hypothetical protein Hanom_Chr01g00013111 [Helianthus anomalus]